MKILMLTPYLPYPPSSGGQVRSYNLIKELSRRHEIHLVGLIKNDSEKKHILHLKKYCKEIYVCKRSKNPWTPSNILKSVFGNQPFVVVRNYAKEAKETIRDILKHNSIDLIHAETFYVMPHIPQTDVPVLLVEQTIEYMVYQHFIENLKIPLAKHLLKLDIFKLKYWEKAYWQKATRVGAVSLEDMREMRKLIPNLHVEIIPNAAGEDLINLFDSKKTAEPIFLYNANFLWLQNVEGAEILARKVFPEIKLNIKNARCIIAGQYANEKLKHLKKYATEIVDLEKDSIEAVKRVYRDSSVFIAPLEGPGGTRLKILGAMAAGLPVISSKTGITGLDVVDKTHVLIARSPHEFAQHAVRLLREKKLFNTIRANARKLVEEEYVYSKIAKKLEKVYLQMLKS